MIATTLPHMGRTDRDRNAYRRVEQQPWCGPTRRRTAPHMGIHERAAFSALDHDPLVVTAVTAGAPAPTVVGIFKRRQVVA